MLFFPYGEFNLTLFPPPSPIEAASFGALRVCRGINLKLLPLPRCVEVHFAPHAALGFPQGQKAQVCTQGLQTWHRRGPTPPDPPGSAAQPLHGGTEPSSAAAPLPWERVCTTTSAHVPQAVQAGDIHLRVDVSETTGKALGKKFKP